MFPHYPNLAFKPIFLLNGINDLQPLAKTIRVPLSFFNVNSKG
jgi:hypothetical protein